MTRFKVSLREAKPIIAATFPEYRGRKVAVEVAEAVTLWDLNWSGGTRNVYRALRADGQVGGGPVAAAPWAHGYEGQVVPIPADFVVVRHTVGCGRDVGITIYVPPALAPRWLPHTRLARKKLSRRRRKSRSFWRSLQICSWQKLNRSFQLARLPSQPNWKFQKRCPVLRGPGGFLSRARSGC